MKEQEINLSQSLTKARDLNRRFKEQHGGDIASCYQCGKCAAGCPLSAKMDYNSREVILLLKNGLYEEALDSTGIWICVGCGTCSERCPRKVNPDAIMEGLHQEASRQRKIGDKPIHVFNDNFLKLVRRHGRVHEFELMIRYNLITGKLLKDAFYAPKMFFKGKLALLPHRIKARQEVKDIFARAEQMGGKD